MTRIISGDCSSRPLFPSDVMLPARIPFACMRDIGISAGVIHPLPTCAAETSSDMMEAAPHTEGRTGSGRESRDASKEAVA